MKTEKPRQGIGACNRALKYKITNHDNAVLLDRRGYFFTKLKKWDDALHNFERALAWKPKFARAMYNRGYTKEKMGQLIAALEDYRKSAKMNPEYRLATNAVIRIEEIINTPVSTPFDDTANFSEHGWCQVWQSEKLLDQERCKKLSHCENESCDIYYHWPSGLKTHILWQDGFHETINGNKAKEIEVQSTSCAHNNASGNTFCFSTIAQKSNEADKTAQTSPSSTSCRLKNGSTSYQQEANAWLEILHGSNPNSESDRTLLCPDFRKVRAYPKSCLKPKTALKIMAEYQRFKCR